MSLRDSSFEKVASASSAGVASGWLLPEERVAAYLGAVAPIDPERIRQHARRITAELPADTDAGAAVVHAQRVVSDWWQRAFGTTPLGDPHARRALSRRPHDFLRDEDAPLAALRALHAELSQPAELAPQHFEPWRLRALLGLSLPTLLGGTATLTLIAAVDAPPLLLWPWAALLGLLVALHATAVSLASVGLYSLLRRRQPAAPIEQMALPETAIVMPVFEEDPERVFSSIAAMREALARTGRGRAFSFHVLSDTQDALHAADEERAWRRLAAQKRDEAPPVYYRRRASNAGKKAGNLAEFAVRSGHRFRYAIVLDADSLMGADTLLRMVERMEANPRLGLLQAPVELFLGESTFARSLQFAHALCGPLLFHGLARFCGPDGNYFGHNAIIRLSAFAECCGLPTLAGAPPFGGPILSHDFVEAALLRRGGFEVRFAEDLAESFEEPPPTLGDYLTRDRRWCQGNLQHLQLVFTQGLSPVSRMHMLFGALAYLVSPLWLLFLALGVTASAMMVRVEPQLTTALVAGMFILLSWPRVLGLLHAIIARRRAFGGVLRLCASWLSELVLSAWLAPVVMLAHTAFVFEISLGLAVDWRAQRRGVADGAQRTDARLLAIGVLGLLSGLLLALHQPASAFWLAPVWVPWASALVSASLSAHGPLARVLGVLGLFTTAVDEHPPPVVRAAARHRSYFHADETARFRDVVLDPVLNHRRREQLVRRGARSNPNLVAVSDKAIARGPVALQPEERVRLLEDPVQLERLHREAWRHWPVESWAIPRAVHPEPQSREETALVRG